MCTTCCTILAVTSLRDVKRLLSLFLVVGAMGFVSNMQVSIQQMNNSESSSLFPPRPLSQKKTLPLLPINDTTATGAFIHVGKTGGSTLSLFLRNGCHSWVPKPCRDVADESVASKLISDYYHGECRKWGCGVWGAFGEEYVKIMWLLHAVRALTIQSVSSSRLWLIASTTTLLLCLYLERSLWSNRFGLYLRSSGQWPRPRPKQHATRMEST